MAGLARLSPRLLHCVKVEALKRWISPSSCGESPGINSHPTPAWRESPADWVGGAAAPGVLKPQHCRAQWAGPRAGRSVGGSAGRGGGPWSQPGGPLTDSAPRPGEQAHRGLGAPAGALGSGLATPPPTFGPGAGLTSPSFRVLLRPRERFYSIEPVVQVNGAKP